MANHKSAEKRARQSVRRRTRNNKVKSTVRTLERRFLDAVETKSKEASTHLREYTSKIMSAVSKGVLKKETASRKIGRLSARIHAALSK